jgi:phosphonate transport system substrate-binding protein
MLRRFVLPLLALVVTAVVARADEKPLTFGLQRTVSDEKATAQATMLEGYLSEALKRPVKARSFSTYDMLAEALAKGDIDIAWINPIPYVRATQVEPGIQPVAKVIRNGATYTSVFFVKAESSAKTLADLKGMRVAWSDPDSASGYLYPKAMIIKSGAVPDSFFSKQSFVGPTKQVCQAVLSGDADVGATFETGSENKELRPDGCLTSLGADVKGKLRAVVASDPIPNEVVAVRKDFDATLTETLGSVFGQMSTTEAGKKLLSDVFNAEGFGAALETDFNTVRAVLKVVSSDTGQKAATDTKAAPGKKKATKKKGK